MTSETYGPRTAAWRALKRRSAALQRRTIAELFGRGTADPPLMAGALDALRSLRG